MESSIHIRLQNGGNRAHRRIITRGVGLRKPDSTFCPVMSDPCQQILTTANSFRLFASWFALGSASRCLRPRKRTPALGLFHLRTFPPFTGYCGSAAPACFFQSSSVSMSICHDCGDIFFGMVMVAVSPSARELAFV